MGWIVRLAFSLFLAWFLSSSLLKTRHSPDGLGVSINAMDEYSYLPQIYFAANDLSFAAFHAEHRTPMPPMKVLTQGVNAPTDYVVGSIGLIMGLSPLEMGLALDLVCVTIASLLIFWLLDVFTPYELIKFLAVATTLTHPTIAGIDRWQLFPRTYGHFVLNATLADFAANPVTRGVYSQIGLLLELSALCCIVRALASLESVPPSPQRSFRSACVYACFGGILAGCTLYGYFFAWLSMGVLCAGLLGGSIIEGWRRKELRGGLLSIWVIVATAAGLCSIPGILIMRKGVQSHAIHDPAIGRYWYFSPDYLLLALLILGIGALTRRRAPGHVLRGTLLIALLFTLAIGPLAYMNIQPVLQRWMAIFRVYGYQIQLLTCLLTVSLLSLCYAVLGALRGRVVAVLLILLSLIRFSPPEVHNRPPFYAELIHFIHDNRLSNESFALWPTSRKVDNLPPRFGISFVPNFIQAMTGIRLLSQSWMFPGDVSIGEIAEREMYLSWLYRGNASLVYPCALTDTQQILPGDILEMTWSVTLLIRQQMCTYLRQNHPTLCDLIKKYQVGYVVQDSRLETVVPRPYLSELWRSSTGVITLFRYDPAKALELTCR